MKKIIYYILLYFLSVIFFLWTITKNIIYVLQAAWRKIRPKKKAKPVAAEGEVILFEDEGNETITPPPSSAQVWGNRAKAGFSQIPKEDVPKLVLLTLLVLFFELFGIYNFIYWATVYTWLGWFELTVAGGITVWAIRKVHKKVFIPIWEDAKKKSTQKLILLGFGERIIL